MINDEENCCKFNFVSVDQCINPLLGGNNSKIEIPQCKKSFTEVRRANTSQMWRSESVKELKKLNRKNCAEKENCSLSCYHFGIVTWQRLKQGSEIVHGD